MSEQDFSFVLSIQPPPLHMSYWDLEPTVSSLSGKTLRRWQVSFTVAGDDRNDEVKGVLEAASNGTDMISDSEGGQWKVGNRTESFQQGTQMYNHTVDLEEHEVLDLAAVEVDGIMLTPDRWYVDGSGVLSFLVSLDAAANAELEKILERHLPANSARR